MNNVFLAGVANVEILKGNDLFATATTLIDSSITLGVSAEDIRGGQGAKLLGKYFHTSTMDLKLSDAMFKLEYIAANIGSEIELGGDVFTNVEVTSGASGEIEIADAVPFVSGGKVYAYAKLTTEDSYKTYEVVGGVITVAKADTKYCVKYLHTNENARKLTVKSNFTPDTLSIYMTANLYTGDARNPEGVNTTKAGTVTIKVPRFLLSGSQEISMSMTGAANTPLEGSALSSNIEGCEGEGIYAEIIEERLGFVWQNEIEAIYFEGEDEETVQADVVFEETIAVYSTISGTTPKKIALDTDYTLTGGTGITVVGNKVSVELATGETAVLTATGIGNYVGFTATKTYIVA